MKKVFLILFIPFQLFSQHKHEVSLFFWEVYSGEPRLSYEYFLTDKWGVEIDGHYQLDGIKIPDAQNYSIKNRYNIDRFSLLLSGKYYFLFNKGNSGLHIGPLFGLDFNSRIEDGAKGNYELVFDRPFEWNYSKGLIGTAVGLVGGHKWVIKNKWAFEFIGHYKVVNERRPANYPFNTSAVVDFDLSIKIGYRFGQKKHINSQLNEQ